LLTRAAPAEFENLGALEELLSEKRGRKVEIHTPQRGVKKGLLSLAETNARHSFDQRSPLLKPSPEAIRAGLQEMLARLGSLSCTARLRRFQSLLATAPLPRFVGTLEPVSS